jgi:hypothetical protein
MITGCRGCDRLQALALPIDIIPIIGEYEHAHDTRNFFTLSRMLYTGYFEIKIRIPCPNFRINISLSRVIDGGTYSGDHFYIDTGEYPPNSNVMSVMSVITIIAHAINSGTPIKIIVNRDVVSVKRNSIIDFMARLIDPRNTILRS